MERIVYLNGEYVKESAATISVFDRGFLFADAVYEVTAVLKGKLIDHSGHLARLERSARELGIRLPVTGDELTKIQRTLIEKNGLVEGGIYLQLTRGSEGDRDFSYSEEIKPTLVLFTQARQLIESPKVKTGIEVISIDDIRWRRRDIKTTSLLPACMAKHAAHLAGAEDVWMIEEGFVTEGGSSNAYIVTKEGTLVTRPLSHDILHGITRASLMALAKEYSMVVEERFFTIEEAYAAQEAFISSATTFIWPVVAIDGKPIGEGKPGEISLRLRDIYIKTALEFAQ
ncbi:D-amino-acid transaminase [Vibrio cincinnatiensis]|jgi:D-alanine transaminase|uniref:Aminodeoxychorismate lyase n=1 Tax=Vibrio cincinnatiensis DSM 19608 TaxID=1123491 RepID=A0A1T4K927_VIBCI|nr:D-amino-acid transaminase [Vibrio cincinnatiensis]MCG3723209.1 D-amino-acid transaminase [Vibrio cincinnatiensis]MCG3724298.1 D-amino-acid transaminase [Vibrio cincinnatiensis]MCG3731325.1 D-amino-acid transaminase [Vibrio cincinnatiensis]MCG3734956.1 D-amino-acid transaminase [Vibrio cincinnatiensis]MCG3738838.1 D-amino-acid transaminase [Vibrio cincinnatiensis]